MLLLPSLQEADVAALGIFGHSLRLGQSTLMLIVAYTLSNFRDRSEFLHHRFFELGPCVKGWPTTSCWVNATL